MPIDLEQRRRDLKRGDRQFYDYVVNFELSRAFDSAGDTASGRSEYVANQLWSKSATARRAAEEALHDGQRPG